MKRVRAAVALMVAAVLAAGATAQSYEDLQKEVRELKAAMQGQQTQINRLEATNGALQSATQDSGLDTEVNRLSERMAAGTNLRSCASQIKMGGEFRYRGYYVNGTAITKGGPFDVDGAFGDMRTRLNFQYDFGCDVTAFAELQAHSGFGEATDGPFRDADGTDTTADSSVGVYQSWLEFRNMFCRPELSCRIGRQEVVLGNQFQFGNADWYNGVVHDGLRVDWKTNCWSLTLLAVKLDTFDGDHNQLPSFFTTHANDELYSAYFTLKSMKCMVLDAYWIYVNGHGGNARNSGANDDSHGFFGDSLYPGPTAYFHTLGARLGGTFNVACGLDYNVEAAFQTGNDKTPLDIDSWTIEGELGLTFNKSSRFRVFARGLFAEGQNVDANGAPTNTGYLTLYPNRHSNGGFRARYGLADLIPMENVFSLQAGLHFNPACNWTVGATGLWAETDQRLTAAGNRDYGTELDFWAEYRYSQQITLGAGLAFVFPDDQGVFAWGVTDDTQFIGYIQARVAF